MKLITNKLKFIEENLKNIEIEYLDMSYIDIFRGELISKLKVKKRVKY